MKVLSLFSGIGAFEKALKKIGIDYELVNYCEIDEHASKAYAAIHGVSEDLNLWDVTTVDTSKLPNNIDLLTHGSPCQSFSIAGKQAGGDKGSGTTSSLMWETVRIVGDLKPKLVIWENVKNVLSKKHIHNFDSYIKSLNNLGYNSYYKVLNAKHYGIPQNRERIFVVSIRKDIDHGKFKFPEPFELKLRLKDMLDDNVDEKYYLSEKKMSSIAHWKAYQKPFEKVQGQNSICPTLTARGAGEEHSGMITYCESLEDTTNLQDYCYNIKPKDKEPSIIKVDIPQTVRVRKYKVDCESLVKVLREQKDIIGLTNKDISIKLNVPLTKVEHWFRRDDCFAIPDEDIWYDLKKVLEIKTNEFDESIMTFEEREGVYEKSNRCYHEDGIAPTLTCASEGEKIICEQRCDEGLRFFKGNVCGTLRTIDACGDKRVIEQTEPLKIRKLTPKEAYRLMGFDDEDFERASAISSDRQLYKQAGNSIVVNVIEEILKKIFM